MPQVTEIETEIPAENPADPIRTNLHGAWLLTADDEYPDQTFPDEKLYFHKNGQLLVDGPDFLCGRYDVIGNQLQIIAPLKGHEIVYLRSFILDRNGLRLKNIRKGFAHYKPMKGMMELCMIDEKWKLHAIGYISIKSPQDWTILGEPPNSSGIQELRIMNPDASKLLLVVRLPVDAGYPQQDVLKITGDIASKLLADTPMAGFRILPAGVEGYFGITGSAYLAETKNPPLTLKVIIKRLPSSAALIFALYSRDLLMELERAAQLIYVDGIPVSSE